MSGTDKFVVHIWRNVKKMGFMPTSHFGHAAVKIKNAAIPGGVEYVSFWPADGASKGKSAFKKQGAAFQANYKDDAGDEMQKLTAFRLEVGFRKANNVPYPAEWDQTLAQFGKAPITNPRPGQVRDHESAKLRDLDDEDVIYDWRQSAESKVSIPAMGAGGSTFGLSPVAAYNWWRGFKVSAPKYQALGFQNCAGVALMCLKAGGSEAFLKLPSVTVYTEPVQVERYANDLLLQINRFNDNAVTLRNDVSNMVATKGYAPTDASELVNGFWPVEVWKKKSALGPLQPRSATIKAIDEALARVHRSLGGTDLVAMNKGVCDLFAHIVHHRNEKADSKRSEAVVRLGHQVLMMLNA